MFEFWEGNVRLMVEGDQLFCIPDSERVGYLDLFVQTYLGSVLRGKEVKVILRGKAPVTITLPLPDGYALCPHMMVHLSFWDPDFGHVHSCDVKLADLSANLPPKLLRSCCGNLEGQW